MSALKSNLEHVLGELKAVEDRARKLRNQNLADVATSARAKIQQLSEHPDLELARSAIASTKMTAASSPNETGDQTGRINKLFRFVWIAGQYRRKLKNWNRTVYRAIKFGLIIAVALAIIYL